MSEQMIEADKLESLTGLSDRRHRQLAKEGYFPIPKNSMYQIAPTIRGMFKYYRESHLTNQKKLTDDRQIKIRREIELLEIKINQQSKRLVDLSQVDRVWSTIMVAMRQTVLAADIPHEIKNELCRTLREIPVDEYFIDEPAEDSEEGSEVDSTTTEDERLAVGGKGEIP